MKLLIALLILSFVNICQAQIDSTSITIGNFVTIESKVLKEERTLQIHLPDDYNNTESKYPILFLLDGPTHFSYASGIVDHLSGYFHHMPKMIIVSLPNTIRNRDFLPNEIKEISQSGGADKFIQFFNEELIPYINGKYRAEDYRIIFGHSFGGTFALYTLVAKPETFDAYIVVSSGHSRDSTLLPYFKTQFESFTELNKFLYITIGDGDHENLIEGNKELKSVLDSCAPAKLKWEYHFMENEDHMSITLISLYDGLKSLFPNWRITKEIIDNGANAFKQHLSGLRTEYGYNVVFPEGILLEGVSYYINKEMYNDAEIMLEIYKEDYPTSSWPHYLFGSLYYKMGNNESAISNYEKYLELDPGNEEVINILKELKKE